MHRRDLLKAGVGVFGVSGLSGCAGVPSLEPDDEPEPESTETPTSETPDPGTPTNSPTPTPTETPVPFPETCEPIPDIDRLPEPPSELTEETAETFSGEFERVYAVATNDEYGGVNTLDIDSVETVDERYVITLSYGLLSLFAGPPARCRAVDPETTDSNPYQTSP